MTMLEQVFAKFRRTGVIYAVDKKTGHVGELTFSQYETGLDLGWDRLFYFSPDWRTACGYAAGVADRNRTKN